MDVCGVYVGDTNMSFGSMRSAYYRDYEQFPYGTLERNTSTGSMHKDSYSRVQEKCKQMKTEKSIKKDCPFCKEHKKRPLITYLRKRDMRKHHESICETKEEEEEEETELNQENEGNNETHEMSNHTTTDDHNNTDSSTGSNNEPVQKRDEDFTVRPKV